MFSAVYSAAHSAGIQPSEPSVASITAHSTSSHSSGGSVSSLLSFTRHFATTSTYSFSIGCPHLSCGSTGETSMPSGQLTTAWLNSGSTRIMFSREYSAPSPAPASASAASASRASACSSSASSSSMRCSCSISSFVSGSPSSPQPESSSAPQSRAIVMSFFISFPILPSPC